MSGEIKLVQSGLSYTTIFTFAFMIFVVGVTIYMSRYFFPVTINVDEEGNIYVKKEIGNSLNVTFKKEDEEIKKDSYSLIEGLKSPIIQDQTVTENASEILGDNLTDPLVTDRMFS